ncbi:DUF3955 domain-containing protein [Puteibacter caeruleilacunae]|nr:DUF3955 domain-containing protein [Puteibacter caeruleilacunae]
MKRNVLVIVWFVLALVCYAIYRIYGVEVQEDGTLQELFVMIPLAYLFVMVGAVTLVIRVIHSRGARTITSD